MPEPNEKDQQDENTNNSENSAQYDESDDTQTEIEASLASLDVTVRTEGKEDCEDLFYNVWEHVTEDAENMTEAMRDKLTGP